jgi:D-3-phosphoglycerate dehydrogenase
MKILVSDSLSKQGVEVLEKAGFTVVVKTKLPKEELLKEIKDADGLIVRSGTKVTAEVIAAAEQPEGRRSSRFRTWTMSIRRPPRVAASWS